MCQRLFFNEVVDLRPAALLKKKDLAQVFSCEFCEIFNNTFFTEHLRVTASDSMFYQKFSSFRNVQKLLRRETSILLYSKVLEGSARGKTH